MVSVSMFCVFLVFFCMFFFVAVDLVLIAPFLCRDMIELCHHVAFVAVVLFRVYMKSFDHGWHSRRGVGLLNFTAYHRSMFTRTLHKKENLIGMKDRNEGCLGRGDNSGRLLGL